MKFLQLKAALDAANLKKSAMDSKADGVGDSSQNMPSPSPPFYSPPSIGQRVITDRIAREPVNKTAALVVSKCPWWAKLIYEEPINKGTRSVVCKNKGRTPPTLPNSRTKRSRSSHRIKKTGQKGKGSESNRPKVPKVKPAAFGGKELVKLLRGEMTAEEAMEIYQLSCA